MHPSLRTAWLLAGTFASLAGAAAAMPQEAPPAETLDALPVPAPGTHLDETHRVEVYHRAATEFLKALPDATRLGIERACGARFELRLTDGRFKGELPRSSLSEDGTTVTTPLGFRLEAGPAVDVAMLITAPNGKSSTLIRRRRRVVVFESDGNKWNSPGHAPAFRLPDATRIDLFEDVRFWEILTLHGERYRLDDETRTWTPLPTIPAPPLIPDTQAAYLAGDGDDWRLPFPEDHTVFAWSWFPYGFTIDNVLEETWRGFRRTDVEILFKAIEIVPPAADLGGYMIARRLGLIGGDRLVIERPGEEPHTVYILPGSLDPDFFIPFVRDQSLFVRHPGNDARAKP